MVKPPLLHSGFNRSNRLLPIGIINPIKYISLRGYRLDNFSYTLSVDELPRYKTYDNLSGFSSR